LKQKRSYGVELHMDHCASCARALLTGALLVLGCNAQQGPEFEAASIKPTTISPDQVGQLAMSGQIQLGARVRGTTAEYRFMTLRQLVAEAYQVLPFQIDCPPWFLEDRFDIVARIPAGARTEDARLMLQSLLASRFHLVLHRESREEAVAALVLRPGAPPPAESAAAAERAPSKKPAGGFGGMMGNVAATFTVDEAASTVRFDAKKSTMADVGRFLTNFGAGGGRPVVDLTGLKGEYDLVLEIPLSTFGATNAEPGHPSDPAAGSITRSLRKYGLELKNRNAPVEHLVIESAQRKPTDN